ncbi:MAG: alpha/beta fold hydrolase [Acidobacteria bacterium]|nr:alpha/beta fold hydrolase [Acidobacteriota bacterium]
MLHPLVPDFHPLPFAPPRALHNGHSMTIFAAMYKRKFTLPVAERREFRTTPDTTIVAYCHWQQNRQERRTAILVHGLEGDADRHYMLGIAEKAWRAGFNVVRMNVRNCGGTEHLTPTLYHSGWTTDLRALLLELITEDQLPALYLIGVSMGANQSLKLAGELGETAPAQLKAVAAISPPIDLELCSIAIRETRNFIYDRRFLRSLKRKMQRKAALFPGICDLEKLSRARKLWDFDEVVTAPHFGFRDARDYYVQASSLPYLSRIRVPALIIHAQDDPFIPFTPFANLPRYEHVALLTPKYGGHVGFWQPQPSAGDNYWAEQVAVDYCSAVAM